MSRNLWLLLTARYLGIYRLLDFVRHDKRTERSGQQGSSCRGIPALSGGRTKRLAAHAQGISRGADRFPRGEENIVEKMHTRQFSRLSLCAYEAGASAVVRAPAILSVAHVLSVSHRSKTAGTESGPRRAVAEN